MTLKAFPTCLFAPDGIEAEIERRTVSGGESLAGDEDLIATDGGGRIFVEFANPFLWDEAPAGGWRAISRSLDGGATPIIVPFCDARHQPTNGSVTVPHSDGSTFSDETEYSQGDASGQITVEAALRATTVQLSNLVMPRALLGSEWFSVDHPVHRWRAYSIVEITAQDTESGTATVVIRPPLREAVTAGEVVDFTNPRCVMRLDGDMRSPTNLGYAESSGVRFVEHFPGPEGY